MATILLQTSGASTSTSLTSIPGTLDYGDDPDDRGGGNEPQARAARGFSLKFQCRVEDSGDQSEASLLALRSGVGPGDVDVSVDGTQVGELCLVDLSIMGDAAQKAEISLKGSAYSA